MKNIIKFILFPHYFIRVKGKFLEVESAYIYMLIGSIIASFRVAYEAKHDLLFSDLSVTLIRILCYLPFLLGASMFIYSYYKPNVVHIDDGAPHWRTQLKLLKFPMWKYGKRTQYEKILTKDLEAKWLDNYDEELDDTKYWWFQGWQPVLLPILCGIVIWIFS